MPPIPTWFRGRDGIGAFLATRPLSGAVPTRLMATRANGQPAFGHYTWDAGRDAFVANDIVVLTMDGESIGEITAFLFTDAIFERFGLPAEIAATRA
jgi:RNA polymerase sigma-70 factor (ECF subfamily)